MHIAVTQVKNTEQTDDKTLTLPPLAQRELS
jgi:hypothetical protein